MDIYGDAESHGILLEKVKIARDLDDPVRFFIRTHSERSIPNARRRIPVKYLGLRQITTFILYPPFSTPNQKKACRQKSDSEDPNHKAAGKETANQYADAKADCSDAQDAAAHSFHSEPLPFTNSISST